MKIKDLIFLIALGGICLKFVWGIERLMDVRLYDETHYLSWGYQLVRQGLPKASWAPLYAVWYFALSLFAPDKIQLYFLNYKMLVILTVFSSYIFLRRIGVRPELSVLFAFLYLISEMALTWPYVTLFALLVVLFFLILASFARSDAVYHGTVWLGLLSASYARPELFVSFMLYGLLIGFLAVRRFGRGGMTTTSIPWLTIIGLGCIALLLVIRFGGIPLFARDHREWGAFGQHFARNYVTVNRLPIDPWRHWREIIGPIFPDAHSIWDAARINRPAFIEHILYNTRHYLSASAGVVLAGFYFASHAMSLCVRRVELFLLMVAIVWFLIRWRKTSEIFSHTTAKRLLIIAGVIALPALAASLVIYPRSHYLILQGFLIAVVLFYILSEFVTGWKVFLRGNFLCLLLALFLIVITPQSVNSEYERDQHRTNLAVIERISSLNITEPINILETEAGYAAYLADNYRRFNDRDKKESFSDFMRSHPIDIFFIGPRLLQSKSFATDEMFKAFAEDPERYNFTRLDISNTNMFLLVKRSVLTKKSVN